MSPSSMICCICSQIAGEQANDLLSRHLDSNDVYLRRVSHETDDFALIPSIGPIVQGHVLICPKKHYRSIAALPSTLVPKYTAFKDEVVKTLSTVFGGPIHSFEHGGASNSTRLICTVEHAHLHLLPAPEAVSRIVLKTLCWSRVGSVEEMAEATRGGEYLSYEAPSGQLFVAKQEDPFESQLMRKIFASALHKGDSWNWRDDPKTIEVEATFVALVNTITKISVRAGR